MSLPLGARLGPYQIEAPIGAGGMGEVYRAHDRRLGRDVALKVLPEAFAADTGRMARFEREAKVLASLSHPNIAPIFGLEDSGKIHALVMELVEGPTLAERIKSSAIPVEEALPIARQICEALEYAHERGIIHRDLKPSNVKVTPEGTVKVLDFGLAKALVGDAAPSDAENSPTLSAMTQAGFLLGTAAYMSPEQAKGKSVDRRTDIWAFGGVLYEMLTGKRAFPGETTSDTLAAVIRADPDWSVLPMNMPPRIRELLACCLKKDPKQRLQAIGDARIALEDAFSVSEATEEPAPPSWQKLRLYALALTLAVIALLIILFARRRVAPPVSLPVVRFSVSLSAPDTLAVTNGVAVAFSPDARRIAYEARHGGSTRLYVRELGQFEAKPLEGTEGAQQPFFSPDGQWLGFTAEGKLKKIQVSGGPVVTLCNAPEGYGATWLPDNTIVFNGYWREGLERVPASGGSPEALTRLDPQRSEQSHEWPDALPGGKAILFASKKGAGSAASDICLLSLGSHHWKTVIPEGSHPHYLPSGHILYAHAGVLMAALFDLNRLQVTGEAFPVMEGVAYDADNGDAQIAVARDGSIVYVPGAFPKAENLLVMVDRAGNERPITDIRRSYEDLYLSPDGRYLALTITGDVWNIWVYDMARGALRRFTFEGDNRDPVWTGDGKHIVFTSFRHGRFGVFWKPADGSGPEEELLPAEAQPTSDTSTSDGKWVLFNIDSPSTGNEFFLLPLQGERKPRLILQTNAFAAVPAISPDGKWLAYFSDESGESEVYVRSLAAPGGNWQISTNGGERPLWARNGRELFFRSGGKVMSVTIQTEPSFVASTPRPLFPYRYLFAGHDYDITPDGQHFIFIKGSETQTGPAQMNVILNWSSELMK